MRWTDSVVLCRSSTMAYIEIWTIPSHYNRHDDVHVYVVHIHILKMLQLVVQVYWYCIHVMCDSHKRGSKRVFIVVYMSLCIYQTNTFSRCEIVCVSWDGLHWHRGSTTIKFLYSFFNEFIFFWQKHFSKLKLF